MPALWSTTQLVFLAFVGLTIVLLVATELLEERRSRHVIVRARVARRRLDHRSRMTRR